MNTAKFLHTRAEFISENTQCYGWVQNIRHFELTISVAPGNQVKVGERCAVRLSSETASSHFVGEVIRSTDESVVFRIPVPMPIEKGDPQARIRLRGHFASVQYLGMDFTCELEDVSYGGLAFVIPITAEPGMCVSIRLPQRYCEAEIVGEIRYCKMVSEESHLYRVGVKFQEMIPPVYEQIHDMMMMPINRAA